MIASEYQTGTLYVAEIASMAPQPPREEVERHVASLPLVQDADKPALINEAASQKAVHDLEQHFSQIPAHARLQAIAVATELMLDLQDTGDGEHFVVTRQDLETLTTRGAIRSAMQTAVDIGRVLHESRIMQQAFDGPIATDIPPAEAS